MTDRDTFAAAALTGLLAGPGDKDFSVDYWARHAYEAADAMLRERERTTNDASPEARDQQSTREPERSLLAQSESVERGLPRTGNTQEPVGWLVKSTGDDREWFCKSYPHSIAVRCTVTPLYRSPTLAPEVRAVVSRGAHPDVAVLAEIPPHAVSLDDVDAGREPHGS